MSNPALKPWENFVSVLKNDYSNFSGRARRSDYWWFGLVFSGLGVLGVILSVVLGAVSEALGLIVLGLLGIAYIGVFIPAIAISIRRLHDINKSGWWLLIPSFRSAALCCWSSISRTAIERRTNSAPHRSMTRQQRLGPVLADLTPTQEHSFNSPGC
jgi:uncharacterized membrane protein YhaH (DUF805 family)